MNTLVIYSAAALHTNTVRDYVEAFGRYLPATVFYEPIETGESLQYSHRLDFIDVVIVHYSANFHYGHFGVTRLLKRLGGFGGLKILFTQDDYDWTNKIREGIAALQPDFVYSVLPSDTAAAVYAEEIEQGIEFVNCLTGYIPSRLKGLDCKPVGDREIDVSYRGRVLPPWYGKLGFEKTGIGLGFKRRAEVTSLKTDIESDTSKRIYGSNWDAFLSNSKTTLASESGCNVFDLDRGIRKATNRERRKNRGISDLELYEKCIRSYEGRFPPTNQISPKMFEAVAFGAVLIMFEGDYSGVFKADRHYLAMKKDFSNFDEIVKLIQDETYLQKIAENASREILDNPDYSYRHFCELFWERVTKDRAFDDHSALDLTEAVGRKSCLILGWGRFSEAVMMQWWAGGKSMQYIEEYGFNIWLKKVAFLMMRKVTNVFR